MPRTIRRQPTIISTNSSDYPQSSLFTQIEFKGIIDTKNDVGVDQSTFVDAENVYVDDVGRLVSRPPFKREGNIENIIKQWTFGIYTLVLTKKIEGTDVLFEIICTSHLTTITDEDKGIYENFCWKFDKDEVEEDFVPEVACVPFEDKILIWFAGIDFIAFNMSGIDIDGETRPYFEYADKYLYLPITQLVMNGITSEYETKNFLTDSYRRRHQLSSISGVAFDKLLDKQLSVSLNSEMTQNTSSHLYDLRLNHSEKDQFIYPFAELGGEYFVDMVKTPNAVVFLRYHLLLQTIEVSFDGKYYTALPKLNEILGKPFLTKDGLGAVAFTKNGLATCKLVAQEIEDFNNPENLNNWTLRPYLEKALASGTLLATTNIDASFTPVGHFETLYQFAYIVYSENIYSDISSYYKYVPTLYSEWISGNTDRWAHRVFTSDTSTPLSFENGFTSIHFNYIPPTTYAPNVGPVVGIISGGPFRKLCTVRFTNRPIDDYSIRSGDIYYFQSELISQTSDRRPYIYKLSDDEKFVVEGTIKSGDKIIMSVMPIDLSTSARIWNSTKTYGIDDVVVYNNYVYISNISNNVGKVPSTNTAAWYKTNNRPYITINNSQLPWHVAIMMIQGYGRRATIVDNSGRDIITNNSSVKISSVAHDITYTADEFNTLVNMYSTDYNTNVSITAGKLTTPQITPVDEIILMPRAINPADAKFEYLTLSNEGLLGGKTDIITRNVSIADGELSYEHIISVGGMIYKCNATLNLLTDSFSTSVSRIYRNDTISLIKLEDNGTRALTEKGLLIDGTLITLPENGQLSPELKNDVIRNNTYLTIKHPVDDFSMTGYIHALTTDKKLSISLPENNSLVIFDNTFIADTLETFRPRYTIKVYSKDYVSKEKIWPGDILCLESTDTKYPSAPSGWSVGDDWPWENDPRPVVIDNGTYRFWKKGDSLPMGYVQYCGYVSAMKSRDPLYIDAAGVWYNINGTLWSSMINDNIVEIDEYINMNIITDTDGAIVERVIKRNNVIPIHHNTLDEHYFSFEHNGKHLLEISLSRYNEADFYDREKTPDKLLYLPSKNEQVFSYKITNLHPLSDTEMGIFTETDVWYIGRVSLENSIYYTQAIKSKIPVGCRDGNEIVTALDGQMLVFCTARGITALAPQDFVATTEKTLTYLSDAIQERYYHFYNDPVENALLSVQKPGESYSPLIKIISYRHWILFYKYMDREILALDTRSNVFWRWTTPYPINSLFVDTRLHALFQIDFLKTPSKLGIPFLWADREVENILYEDDVIENALTGRRVYTDHWIYEKASPQISWNILSQRLHFNLIDNYKAIKGFNINAQGDGVFRAKISTKIYRNSYHPEQSDIIEIEVNDLRTLVKRLNLMHVLYFQYSISNELTDKNPQRLKLNSLGIKYEVKERIR